LKKFQEKILKIVKDRKGISYAALEELLNKKEKLLLSDELQNLISNDHVIFIWNKYYPAYRSIGVFLKNTNDMIDDITIAYISVDELKSFMIPDEDDPKFYNGYLIDEKNREYFEKPNNFKLDFEKFDYYLLCGFDNSGDIQTLKNNIKG
jgi:hypothetical protein